jgi:low affinity Fe/Cu permease
MHFSRIAQWTSHQAGKPLTFVLAVACILLWAICGPFFYFSDTWQLVVNTSTTIISFLMLFLVQATQNRDTPAIHLKLDELLRVTKDARNTLVAVEEKSDVELREEKEKSATLLAQDEISIKQQP